MCRCASASNYAACADLPHSKALYTCLVVKPIRESCGGLQPRAHLCCSNLASQHAALVCCICRMVGWIVCRVSVSSTQISDRHPSGLWPHSPGPEVRRCSSTTVGAPMMLCCSCMASWSQATRRKGEGHTAVLRLFRGLACVMLTRAWCCAACALDMVCSCM